MSEILEFAKYLILFISERFQFNVFFNDFYYLDVK